MQSTTNSRGGSALTAELGALPPITVIQRTSFGEPIYGFTADQMRAYASEQVAAERERCAQLLDAVHEQRKHIDNYAACYALMVREARLIEGPNV